MRSNSRRKLDERLFVEQVQECMNNGYLLSSKKIGSGAFSKVYLAYATRERMKHNPKLASDLRAKRHSMVAIKIVSMAEAPVEYSRKFLPREISSLNATYKHLNIVQLYETYQNSQRSYLVLELAARGDLLEHINAVSDLRGCPGLEEEEARRLFWQLVSAVAHCHDAGIVHRDLKCENILLDDQGFLKLTDFGFANCVGLKNSLLSTFCGSVAYTAPEILMSKKYNGEQADLWSLGIILHAMVSGKLPFKEHQPHRMLHLIRRGPVFKPGLSSGEQHYSILLPGPSSGLESSQRLGPQSAKRMIWVPGPDQRAASAASVCTPGPTAGSCSLLDAARRPHALLCTRCHSRTGASPVSNSPWPHRVWQRYCIPEAKAAAPPGAGHLQGECLWPRRLAPGGLHQRNSFCQSWAMALHGRWSLLYAPQPPTGTCLGTICSAEGG
ncbi:testis-specific serine/threonine-protein kinase 5-like isoform X2 [Peromyscus maniculatus bairdii]|uniref:testis-specific serine/threonine-protein kinase 5-like isoform X2 n=1 Tax=Peromyscus maniculatus bairdii TaxID=230844 RepID=UPI003FD50CF4